MKVAIIGGRTFNDYSMLKDAISIRINELNITQITSGGARGADSLAEKYAHEKHIFMVVYHPEWDKYGRGAGFIRNKLIIDDSDVVFAFWDGASKGTLNSINLAEKAGKVVHVIRYDF